MAMDVHCKPGIQMALIFFTNSTQIFGVATSIWSVVIFFFLPDTINQAGFLTEEEKQYAEDRVVTGGTGRTDPINSQWKIDQVYECLLDPKTYFFAAMSVLTQVCSLTFHSRKISNWSRFQMAARKDSRIWL